MTSEPTRRSPSRIRLPLWVVGLFGIAVIIFLIGSGVWLFRTVQQVAAEIPILEQTDIQLPAPTPIPDELIPAPVISETSSEESPTTEIVPMAEPVRWEGRERITILLLGIDRRCGEEGPVRTDSMIVLTIDPVGKTAALLSLPRDLWVEIPGFGVDRINQAHYFGEGFEYPGGGPALAVDTVESTLGIDISYYATVNFLAFVEAVDILGGIELDVPETIDDPDYPDECYGYDPFYLEAGWQQLDGATALKYARTRSTEGGDVDRAARQQAVLLAVREKAVAQVPDLLVKAPLFWQSLQKNVETTMSLDEAAQLAILAQEIPRENIRRAVIDYTYVYVEKTPDGQDVLVPIRENIRALRDELFAAPEAPPITLENVAEQIASEQARLAVYNGTQTFGLAAATQDYLLAKELDVVEIGNADSAAYTSSQIIDFGDHPVTVQYLIQLMNIPPLNVSTGRRPDGDYDLLIIIGSDWEIPAD